MTDLVKVVPLSLLQRTRDLATMSEDEIRRFAAEAARNRDASALWALTEAHLTLHGSSGSRVSSHTLSAYRHAVGMLLEGWSGENLLRPSRNAGVLWVRELEGRFKAASVRIYLVGAKALYAAFRWSGATDSAPFADVKVAVDKTPAWEKREAYTQTEMHWLECCSEGVTLLVIILGAHAGLERVPVIVHEIDDAAAANLAVLDNLHRADLNPIEETEVILQLVQSSLVVDRVGAVAKVRAAANVTKGRPQEGIDDEELTALRTLFDRSIERLAVMSFANARLPLLGLPEEIYRAVLEGRMAYTVATPLKAVKDEDRRRELLQRAIEEALTREQVKRLVAEANEPPVSIRDLEGRMKPARHLVSTTQLRELAPAKRREFVRLVEEFVSRAEVLLGDVREISEV